LLVKGCRNKSTKKPWLAGKKFPDQVRFFFTGCLSGNAAGAMVQLGEPGNDDSDF